ncbi:hypothetical protein FLAVO9AF_370016 [Flavobacterium sp. 9AF]|nr:hypothetical protein FLAVO9AF_370016 [Flavobacterium sp. 9AF]
MSFITLRKYNNSTNLPNSDYQIDIKKTKKQRYRRIFLTILVIKNQ